LKTVIAKRAVGIFLPLALLAVAVLYVLYRTQEAAVLAGVRGEESKAVEIGRQRIESTFGVVVSDIGFLSEQYLLRQWLETGDAGTRRNLGADYLQFAIHQAVYDQVRVIDLHGQELVRVLQNNGRFNTVADDRLKNEGDAYYITETAKLDRGQIYVSPLDLTAEDGVIRQPIEPVIRFGVPLFDSHGDKKAVLMLNYQGRRVIDRLKILDQQVLGDIWLTNDTGYWLRGPHLEDEYAFMYPGKNASTFKNAYPDVWAKVRHDRRIGDVIDAKGNLFTYGWIDVVAQAAAASARVDLHRLVVASPMMIVAFASADKIAAQTWNLKRNSGLAGGIVLLLLAVASWAAARQWASRDANEQSVRQSEARFRGFMESAPDAVVVVDGDGNIVFVNGQVQNMFGYRREQIVGRPIETLVPERYRGRHIIDRNAYMASPRMRPMGSGLELFGLRMDGSEVPVSVNLSPVETEQGTMIYAGIRDVTERRQAQKEIEALNQKLSVDNVELQTLNRELEAFSYSVSHDLRAPLRSIDGFSQALQEDCAERLDDTGRGYIARVRGAAQRMGHLIDDLLKLSRVTRSELRVTEVDLSAAAEAIVRTLREREPERHIEVSIAPNVKVLGDSDLLDILLENLIGNAWKFTARAPRGKIEVGYVSKENESKEDERQYFVRDNGAGFDMAYSAKLFGAFQRLHDASEYPGTGIGLATVQRIVHKHGGRIWAESAVNKGATFYFTLRISS
jgi:PAS domain S-box-containing protein